MSYGVLTPEMLEALEPLVNGKTVWDLGCGNLGRAKVLALLGARVIGVDKEWPSGFETVEDWPSGVSFHRQRFDQVVVNGPADIAFVAWPSNRRLPGLLGLLQQFGTVVYLGQNRRGTSCGWPGLFSYLGLRELKGVVEHDRNDLLIYGPWVGYTHKMTREERHGFYPDRYGPLTSVGDAYTDDLYAVDAGAASDERHDSDGRHDMPPGGDS